MSSLLFLLVREGQGAKLFVCPSTGHSADQDLTYTDSSGQEVYAWDFNSWDNLDYSYQAPINDGGEFINGVTIQTSSSVVILADRGPYASSAGDTGSAADVTNLSGENLKPHMSQNHDNGGFINTLYADGHVSGHQRPDVGVDDDNIYTASNDNSQGSQSSTELSASKHYVDVDSYLITPRK